MESSNSTPVSSNHLVDYDWRIKAIVGSSTTIAQPPPPIAELDLHLCTNSLMDEKAGNVTETIKLEVNSQELKMLISSLEKSLSNA